MLRLMPGSRDCALTDEDLAPALTPHLGSRGFERGRPDRLDRPRRIALPIACHRPSDSLFSDSTVVCTSYVLCGAQGED